MALQSGDGDRAALDQAVLSAAFDDAPVPAAILTLDGVYMRINSAFAMLLDHVPAALLGLDYLTITHPDDRSAAAGFFTEIREGRLATGRLEKRLLRRDGSTVCVAFHSTMIPGPDHERLLLCQVIDLTEQRRAEAKLARHATHDPLTGLTSRIVFLDFVTRALARLPRTSGRHAVALFLDLDRLKYINDTYGHAVGDVVLAEFASRVRSAVRPSDVVARIGGDEFAVLLEDVEHPRESAEVAQRILDVLAEPFETNGRRVEIRASIGIAVSASNRVTPAALLAHADAAMYRAKQRGRGRFELFDEDAYSAAMRRENTEGELRAAASAGELSLHFQPLLDLGTGRLTGVEALLRWEHPVRGLLPAADFIAVAEESDLLRPLTGWLFTTACDQMVAWDVALGAVAPEHLYVNLAGSQLGDEHVVRTIAAAVSASGLAPARLNLEITETQMFGDPAATAQSVAELRALGCRLVVDDFGTGYSSLSRLTQLPVSGLKIDRSFVRNITTSRESAAIAASVVLLAHNLRHTVIAEGIETAQELIAVTELGCDLAQGYHIARPAPAAELTSMFRRGAASGQLRLS